MNFVAFKDMPRQLLQQNNSHSQYSLGNSVIVCIIMIKYSICISYTLCEVVGV